MATIRLAANFSCLGPDARNGLSLARNSCPFQGLHSGVNIPGLLLRFRPADSSARSTFQLHYRNPVRPGSGGFSASGPLPNLRLVRLTALSDLRSPFGVLRPSGSKCSTRTAACQSAFRIRPIPFAPRNRFLLLDASATDQRSRSATFPEARCSSNKSEAKRS